MNFQHVQVRLRIAGKWYQALAVLFFLMVTYVILGLASPGLADTDLGVVDTGVKWPVLLAEGAIYIAILFRLFLRPKHYLRAAAKFTTILPLIAICFLSSLWSSDPYLTVRRAAALLLSSIVALIIGADFELKQIIRFFSAATVIHMLLVAVFFVVSPHTLYSPSDPVSLKGLTTHKNVFGHEMALGFLALALVPFRRWAMLRWPLAFACFGLLRLASACPFHRCSGFLAGRFDFSAFTHVCSVPWNGSICGASCVRRSRSEPGCAVVCLFRTPARPIREKRYIDGKNGALGLGACGHRHAPLARLRLRYVLDGIPGCLVQHPDAGRLARPNGAQRLL